MAVILLSLVDRAPHPQPPAMRLAQVGWDLCVLSAGATPGIFATAYAVKKLGNNAAVAYGFAYFTACFIGGAIVGRIRSKENLGAGGAATAMGIGGALLGGLVGIVW